MIELMILLPIVIICGTTLIVANTRNASIRRTLIAMAIAAVVSGVASAGTLRYVVITNPTMKTEIEFSQKPANGKPQGNNAIDKQQQSRKIKNNEKWSGDFWNSVVNK